MAFVYLLHFATRYPNGKKPQHYLGVAQDAEARFTEHLAGSSKSRLTRACAERGIKIELVRTWTHPHPKAAFDREREIKRRKKNYAKLCPLCTAAMARFGVAAIKRAAR
jgi:predicted GIY-YIG superfamily endonuclease